MTPLNTQQITQTWRRIQSNVAAQLPPHQAPPLHNCFEAVLDGGTLHVTAPRGYADMLNRIASRSASVNAQRFDLASEVLFVEPEEEPEPLPEIDTAVEAPSPEPFSPPLVQIVPNTRSPGPNEPGYDPWADVARNLATAKAYKAQRERTGASLIAQSHEQVVDSDTEKEEQPKVSENMNTSQTDLDPVKVWRSALSELELQMTSATFNTWLKDAAVGGFEADTAVLTILCRNDYAVDWLSERLQETVERTISAVAGQAMTVRFAVTETRQKKEPEGTGDSADAVGLGDTAVQPFYDDLSWPDPRKNFTMTPDHLFEQVLPRTDIKPSTKTLVQIVLYNTLGNLDKNMKPRDWWCDVSQGDLCYALGITPKTLRVAIGEALAHRMIKRRKATRRHCYDYALLFKWEGGEWDEEACE